MPFYIFMRVDWKEMFVRSVVDHCRVVRCEEGEALHSCMSDLQQCQLPGMTWKICWRLHSIVWTRWKHLPATWRNPSQQVFCLTVWTDQSCTVAASRILFGAGSSLQSVMFVQITILDYMISELWQDFTQLAPFMPQTEPLLQYLFHISLVDSSLLLRFSWLAVTDGVLRSNGAGWSAGGYEVGGFFGAIWASLWWIWN
jgi:hypothetical protein